MNDDIYIVKKQCLSYRTAYFRAWRMSGDRSLFWCFVDFFLIFFCFIFTLVIFFRFISVELHFFYANFMWNHKNDKTLTNQNENVSWVVSFLSSMWIAIAASQTNQRLCSLCITTNRIFMLNFCPYFLSLSFSLSSSHSFYFSIISLVIVVILYLTVYSMAGPQGDLSKTTSESWAKLFFNMK